MFKIFTTLLFSSFVFFIANGQVLINEYTGANYDTYTDNYGEHEDWVELYNPTAAAIDISGWYLSDKVNNPTKWVVPSSFIVPANGTVIIYCSGRDELIGGNAHSNFKITQTKGNEVFMLSDPGSVLQDSIRVFPNQNSHSRGRETDGAANWSVFTNATPNASNMGAMQEYATTPIFSQAGGYNAAAVNLTLSSPDPNITIYYTTNGDEPDNTSVVYAGSINIATTTVIKAIAYSSIANIPASFIDFHTFFINDTHTIPILSISGDSVDVLIEDGVDYIPWWSNTLHRPKGTIEWFDASGVLLDKGAGEYNKHGNDSWNYNQRGFDYVMRDQFGYNYALQDQIFSTKSRNKFQRIIVKAAANDNYPASYGGSGAHIRDAYVHHLSQIGDLRLDERSTSSCIVYLNGDYWGVYEMREKVDDHDFTDYYYDQDKNNLQYLKTWGWTWSEYGGPQAQTDWDNFVNWVLANPMSNQANYNQAKSEYNMGSLIDYFLLNAYVVCQDWLNWNTGWWRGMDPNGDKKKWRYTLWDMDNTFDHGTNYTGIPSSSPTAEPCDPSTLGNVGGQGHVPIWNEMLTNQEFHDDYINRWLDLANGPLSCSFMIHILDSMVAVIDPEMPRQILRWPGGTYIAWQSNVTDLRNWILARCDSMNSGFIDCDSAITDIFDVTVEIIGIGEVEMSNGNFINQNNTGWTDQRFGGIALPFEVQSGSFDHWEVLPAGSYMYDPILDTLVIDLQGDVTVQAYFVPPVPTRDITYNVVPTWIGTNIIADGVIVNAPTTISYTINDTVNIDANINPLYAFSTWASDSVTLMPIDANLTDSFYVSNHDNVTLYIYKKPTIVYDIYPIGTTTTITINGVNTSSFPSSPPPTYYNNETITLLPNIDPLYSFVSWDYDSITMLNGNSEVNSFVSSYNDTVRLVLNLIPPLEAFIAGNDTICNNDEADVSVSFISEFPPYSFVYAINGINQATITTDENPYYIKTKTEGIYTLSYFSDAINSGSTNGSALVTVLEAPTAIFITDSDTISILYTTLKLQDLSDGNIVAWQWDFGDGNTSSQPNPHHPYQESLGIYQISLIVADDMGCSDTVTKQIWITDDYWMYIPNSFTPDHDGVNDVFCLQHHGIRAETFLFNIYDRFSNLVYATDQIEKLECFLNSNGWDGKHFKTGNDLPMGTYVYQVYFQDFEGWKHQERGHLFIVR